MTRHCTCMRINATHSASSLIRWHTFKPRCQNWKAASWCQLLQEKAKEIEIIATIPEAEREGKKKKIIYITQMRLASKSAHKDDARKTTGLWGERLEGPNVLKVPQTDRAEVEHQMLSREYTVSKWPRSSFLLIYLSTTLHKSLEITCTFELISSRVIDISIAKFPKSIYVYI